MGGKSEIQRGAKPVPAEKRAAQVRSELLQLRVTPVEKKALLKEAREDGFEGDFAAWHRLCLGLKEGSKVQKPKK